ncbi:MAG: hypothetical protein NC212_09770 [Staphylococcus sp.]|nr:hypothetical protein [Staphylococcus sp.]
MRALLYIVLLMVVTGCGYSSSCSVQWLDEAQSMMESNPAKAFEKLNEHDVAEFNDSATMARWALLYSEAMAANRLTAPTDTIINIAINYYDSHNQKFALDRALEVKSMLANSTETDALVTALYLQKEKEFMLYRERTKTIQIVMICMIVILIAVVVILLQRQRLRLKAAEMEALMAEASALKEGLSLRQSECLKLNERLTASFANRFGVIDDLCGTYYESQGTKTEKKAIADKVKAQIESLKSDEGIFSEMEKCHEDLLRDIRRDIPDMKPEEYRLTVYLASGLSNRTIALLIGESIDVAYKRKSRLKAKISALTSPDKERYLAVF